jgi:predicted enzyme involved in methoxymalonyl-ACP biosynthesis
MGAARDAGVKELRAVYKVNERNLPMRLLFRQMGFEAIGKGREDLILASRDLSEPLPPYPEWLRLDE